MEDTIKDYNTRRPPLIIPEYGRNIQKMVEYAKTIEDRDERNKVAHAIIQIMGQLNPHLRDISDFTHKLWDHLFIISNYELDVDSPYPKPVKEKINAKPEPLHYPQNKIRFKHYGKVIENLVKKACELPDGEEKQVLVGIIANMMKKSYLTWNRESVEDTVLKKDLATLSNNRLNLDVDFEFKQTSEILAKSKKRKSNGSNHKNKNNRRRKY
ncbi:MAG: DUF4290 domain-containing protein [Vicingaceae bacterium]|jgi:hypothetical protein